MHAAGQHVSVGRGGAAARLAHVCIPQWGDGWKYGVRSVNGGSVAGGKVATAVAPTSASVVASIAPVIKWVCRQAL